MEPAGAVKTSYVGDVVTLICDVTESSSAVWSHQGYALSATGSHYSIYHEATHRGSTLSHLTIQGVMERDHGTYQCKNPKDLFDMDEITLTVSARGEGKFINIMCFSQLRISNLQKNNLFPDR